jgi:hypothetical protein
MPASKSVPGVQPARASQKERLAPEAFRVLDWTNLDSPPTTLDVKRMSGLGGNEGIARFAVLVNTPRMLRAANVFAEQAGLQGAQVRVFVDSKEALAWLYKDFPAVALDWPG